MEFVLVPPGEFMMGEKGVAEPVHKVTITKPFYMGRYEVTQAQYEKVTGTNPSKLKGADLPIEQVSWDDAKKFVAQASGLRPQSGGLRYTLRLPTEAEWEYACRAGTTTEYNTGQGEAALERAGWYNKNSRGKTNPVGKKAPNAWGLYDMHGNVWEWVQDCFSEKYYGESPSADPKGPANGGERVLRGGGWNYGDPVHCRAAHRGRHDPGFRSTDLGSRLALDVPGAAASVAAQPQTTDQKPETGVTDAWIKMVQAQPAEKQVEEVVKKLKELNPGLGGVAKATSTVFDLAYNNSVRDISALKALRELRGLACHHSSVTDLSPLRDLPLRGLICDFVPERDAEILRSIKTLEKINDMPVAEFWKKYAEAGAAKAAGGGDRPWKPIFDGKTLDGFKLERPDSWEVQNGVLVKRAGSRLWSNAKYRDGEIRFRFEASDLSGGEFAVRHTGLGEWCIFFDRGLLARLKGTVNELVFNCQGDVVTASLNGEAAKVGKAANPSQDGGIKLNSAANGSLRILSLEYRELAPAPKAP